MIPRISRNAVKEGFDTLPAAICYFDRNGLLRLINHRMQEIAAVLCGRDLQTLTDLEQALIYAANKAKTLDEGEQSYAVTGINCRAETAALCHGSFSHLSSSSPGYSRSAR